MHRRTLLAALGTCIPLSGCLGARNPTVGATETPTPSQPEECPVSQSVGVPLPDEITENEVRSFVRDYEQAYIYEKFITEEMSVGVGPEPTVQDVAASNHGIVVHVHTVWSATTVTGTVIVADPKGEVPDDVDPVDIESLPDSAERVATLAREAATENKEARWEDSSQDHEEIVSELGAAHVDDGYYVTVEGVPVLVRIVPASEIITDGEEFAWYHVDEGAVRRTDDRDQNATDGDLMECYPTE